jgi:hypothetical protein
LGQFPRSSLPFGTVSLSQWRGSRCLLSCVEQNLLILGQLQLFLGPFSSSYQT